MAITVEARTSIIELVVGMFGAAPGASVLSDLVAAYESGMTLPKMADHLASTDQFKSIYPTFLTNTEFATKLVDNMLGSEVGATDKAAAVVEVAALLNAGQSRGQVFLTAVQAVDAVTSTNTVFANAGAAFDNKVAVATYYSVDKQLSGSSLDALQNVIKDVTSAAASVTTAQNAVDGVADVGKTFVLTNTIDNLTGTSGNDVFIGDNTTQGAGDSINGGAGTDTLKLFSTVTLGNLTSVEAVEIDNQNAAINTSTNAGIESVKLSNTNLAAAQTITMTAAQTLSLSKITDTGSTGSALTVAGGAGARTINIDGLGSLTTAADDVVLGLSGGATATTLNLASNGTASNITLNNAAGSIRTLNISGDASVTERGGSIGGTVRTLDISNTGTTTMSVSTAGTATTGLTVTGAGGKEVISLTQAAGANALNDKVSVNLGAGDDTLAITALTAATDINAAAKFNGGDGTDVLAVAAGAVINATTGKQFSGFETVAITAGNYDLSFLASTNTIGTLSVADTLTAAVVVSNLAEAANVNIGASTGAFALTLNQKDAGAGSPDDAMTVTLAGSAVTGAARTTNTVTINDIETVNLVSTGGTSTTTAANTFGVLAAAAATKITASASANSTLTISDLDALALVLFDASASTGGVLVTTGAGLFSGNAGTAFKGGAGADTFVLTGATATSTTVDFLVTGNGGQDTITLSAAGQVEHVVYLAQADSTAAKYDKVGTFTTTEDKIDLKAFGFTGTADDALLAIGSGVSINGVTNAVEVTSAAAGNFFNDAGIDRAVASIAVGGNRYVFVDVNKDGDFSAAADLVIELTGAIAPVIGDFIFA